jgi:hypothetical protein
MKSSVFFEEHRMRLSILFVREPYLPAFELLELVVPVSVRSLFYEYFKVIGQREPP